jgi:hypothetical protein
MRDNLRRDIPAGAAITVVALVLLASVVTGREGAAVADSPQAKRAPEAPAELDDVDVSSLVRQRNGEGATDLFARRSWTPIPAPPAAPEPPKAVPPPAPSEPPPLPFTYLGRMVKPDTTLVYLLKNQDMLVAEVGTTLEADYKIEAVSDSAVDFVYLPLGRKQTLAVSTP